MKHGLRQFAMGEVKPEARLNGEPMDRFLRELDRVVNAREGSEGVNGLVVVAARGDAADVYKRVRAVMDGRLLADVAGLLDRVIDHWEHEHPGGSSDLNTTLGQARRLRRQLEGL